MSIIGTLRELVEHVLRSTLPPDAFSLGQASTVRRGVAALAAVSDVAAGTDTAKAVTAAAMAAVRPHGEVRLVKNSTYLKLERKDRGFLLVDGSLVQIPSVGITLGATGTTANTTYYIYAKTPAALELEASTTTYTISSDGIAVKTGDATKTLVGMARTDNSGAWADSDAQRFVLSYFNRRTRRFYAALTSDKTPTTSSAEVTTSGERAYVLTWLDEPIMAGARVTGTQAAGGTGLFVGVGLDGTAQAGSVVGTTAGAASVPINNSIPALPIETTEGFHYVGLHAYVAGTSSTILGATSPGSAVLGTIRG